MAHPQRERLVAVLGERQGSGYLIERRLVLTAAHVVGGDPRPQVVAPGGGGPVACRVVWSRYDRACDAALLEIDSELGADNEPVSWGRWDGLSARAGAYAIGFPQVQRDGGSALDTEQLVGTLKPGTGLLGGRPVLDSGHGAPTGESPWAGLSGAPVFLDGTLMGLVRADPGAWSHQRVELTPGHVLLVDRSFRDRHRVVLRPAPDEEFEQRLRTSLAREWNRVTIFGVTRSSALEDSWPLDVAYLGLELSGGAQLHDDQQEPLSRRVDDAFAGQRRVLLRGEAGSGKTTLLQWLTTLAARGELPPGLKDFHGAVPLLLRLRALARDGAELPGPEEFLRAAGSPLAGAPGSDGWVSRRMAQGRLLLLVDGIDEAPAGQRRRVREWLGRLLAAYPDVPCVVTTRPSAVGVGWLRELDFEELSLLPMSRADVRAFVDRWHQAARQAAPQRAGQLSDWQHQLVTALDRKPDLSRLATNPLMCSLICALNVDRRGYLPADRLSLYDAALEMLLVRRDQERGVAADSEGFALGQGLQHALLEKLAYWLIRNGQSELTEEQALHLIDRARPQMGVDTAPDLLLRHLLVRSGLLREPAPGAVDFVHRTFQDYLGAQAAVEEGDLPLLVGHAHEDQWEDVLRLAVGHARRRERAELLTRILDRADAEPEHAHRLRLLAAICLELALEVDPEVRRRAEAATAELIPPRSPEEAKALAAAGPVVLELLPGPEGLDEPTAEAVVVCATTIATERALPLLAAYTGHPSRRVLGQLAWSWERFDTHEYGEQIVSRLPTDGDLRFMVRIREEVAFLAALGGRTHVEFVGDLGAAELELLPAEGLEQLWFQEHPGPIDLAVLSRFPALRRVRFTRCPDVDVSGLRFTGVESLTLKESSGTGLDSCSGLRSVDLWNSDFGTLPSSLDTLTLDPADGYPPAWLDSLPGLRTLQLFRGSLPSFRSVHPSVEQLDLTAVRLTADAAALLPVAFPALRTIRVRAMEQMELLPSGYEIVPG